MHTGKGNQLPGTRYYCGSFMENKISRDSNSSCPAAPAIVIPPAFAKLHAAFREESRRRGCVPDRVTANPGSPSVRGTKTMGRSPGRSPINANLFGMFFINTSHKNVILSGAPHRLSCDTALESAESALRSEPVTF
jgi:hypothetical protein